ncbi:FtsX-like permease family protein [Jiella sp. M17.18]|uniref:FtsX-like permease family protein n=1 Tax=Jiella sp. M17.18 TaxID=3234247 RepID=UPI0034DE2491
MRSLDRKLLREIWRLRAQVLAIALVVASGAALLIMSRTAVEALQETADAFYERTRFADVFAGVKRAPERLSRDIAAIPGVTAVETRILETAILDVPGFTDPVIGELVSLPKHGEPVLNRLTLRSGRLPEPDRPDEVALSEPFAAAHRLRPGDRLDAVLHGRRRSLAVVGTLLSPEFVYAISPGGLMPDDQRFGVLWMGRDALAAAYDMKGSFNAVAIGLLRGADQQAVIDRLDGLLDRYGGRGAYARADQLSNWFLQNEIEQQKNMSHLLPTIFLCVAAFLTNMVMARLIATERREIGLLKAFGYSSLEIGWHYAKMVLIIAGIGVAIGSVAGAWLGRWDTALYATLYHFPFLLYRPGPAAFLTAGLVSLGAALAGSMHAVRKAVRLPPAEAMLPPAPPSYHKSRLAPAVLGPLLDEPTRMILRRVLRWPLRAFATSAGIAMSVAVLVMALQWIDAVDFLVDSTFVRAQRQDASIAFGELEPLDVTASVLRLPGVEAVEPFRSVSARLSHGPLSKREAITGVPARAELSPVFDAERGRIEVPPDGLLLSRKLAERLGVKVGDEVTVAVQEGRRPVLKLPVAQLFETYIGTPAYMQLGALDRILKDGRVANGVHVAVDPARRAELVAEIKRNPAISAVTFRQAAIDKFHETLGRTMFVFVGFLIGFASTLSIGVTYNSARIALAERARELATLRVLGFSRTEIAYILLGEVGLLTWFAIPLGCATGFGLAVYLAGAFETELFRVPLVITDATYGKAALITLAATAACAVFIRRRLDRLDLVAVLKTRE